ncbi:MAG: isoprenylcysteine carboxylmethyltransferase family protein [Pseudomonadota bacterium]|uniref:Isoprenylcysteine carboxyl methyltransferase (ICMT) family protein n=1 Tax=anaerobic digester metagenome TaxID=1263854 RepID=A0A485M5D2_9ZZZZ|nr:isoprenylcysteine carboxylmethyltransferase family protein [Pseudomonadota bacterium]HON39108.1 isoprenylcysteine carboxylmethyltransferase family protein [Deltaproteobacteria bacterium]HRS56126.1 isoprenylcysteine carboxylmethyltransferase family protein [Desulfomonilia bacterium]HPD21197.1 isoprenylcysteine carboxylmethyltransferase family protein [Deltaproteobacteria bacterium]HPX18164.1 isoprenylcysteine carboxylmethyltransferase family protein [Deltaproteobacteria bacterium]
MSEPKKIWYRLRGALIVPFYLFALLFNNGEINNPWVIYPLGTVLFMLGLGLRIWAQMHLHYRLKVHKTLTLTGPYLYVRNPIYIGNTLILAGITVLAGLLWFVPVMVIACGFTYHMTVLYEEGHLTRKYGQGYVEFLERIPRWLPRLRPAQDAPAAKVRSYFLPSVVAELHILLLLIPLFFL